MYQYVLPVEKLVRNPHAAYPDPRVDVPEVPGNAPVYPASVTLTRFNDFHTANRFTSACSTMVYRDDLFGAGFENAMFVSEPVHNLVHRSAMSRRGLTWSSRRVEEEQRSEFLASTDNWFRPTMIKTGPDGALWIADMYRLVIEHPEWIPIEWQQRLDLRAGHDRGRIYRVAPVGVPRRPRPKLAGAGTAELVEALVSPNGWQRDMAQRLLVERGDPAAVAPLEAVVARRPGADDPPARRRALALGRLHALCTLDGLRALTPGVLTTALGDPEPMVRRHAVRLAPTAAGTAGAVWESLERSADDPDAAVRFELALALGDFPADAGGERAGRLLGRLAAAELGKDPYLDAALMSSLRAENLHEVLAAVLRSGQVQQPERLEALFGLAAQFGRPETLDLVLDAVTRPAPEGKPTAGQIGAVGVLLDHWGRDGATFESIRRAAPAERRAVLDRLAKMLDEARKAAAAAETPPAERAALLKLLGREPSRREEDRRLLMGLMTPQSPLELQLAAVDALARSGTAEHEPLDLLLDRWDTLSPKVRQRVLDLLLTRPAGAASLATQIYLGNVSPSELDANRRRQLLDRLDENLRDAAAALLDAGSGDRKEVVRQQLLAAERTGDPARGREQFQRVCAQCHKLGDLGHDVGPDLRALTDKSNEALVVAIYDPNRAVESKYISYTAVTTNGQSFSGMIAAETGTGITLRGAEGKEQALLLKDLEELKSSSQSLMPEGLEKDLSGETLADLLAFLQRELPQPERKRFAGNNPSVRNQQPGGSFMLAAEMAEIYGPTLVFEEKYGNLGYWSHADDYAVWTVNVTAPGRFAVWIDYACHNDTAGNEFELTARDERLTGRVQGTGTWDDYAFVQIGELPLPEGKTRLVMRSRGAVKGAMIDLRSIKLVPAK
jgi:putative heme-binding domain-containing protein